MKSDHKFLGKVYREKTRYKIAKLVAVEEIGWFLEVVTGESVSITSFGRKNKQRICC